jgi:hypothetical protein
MIHREKKPVILLLYCLWIVSFFTHFFKTTKDARIHTYSRLNNICTVLTQGAVGTEIAIVTITHCERIPVPVGVVVAMTTMSGDIAYGATGAMA